MGKFFLAAAAALSLLAVGCATDGDAERALDVPAEELPGTGGSGSGGAEEMPRTGDDQSATDEGGFSEIPTRGD